MGVVYYHKNGWFEYRTENGNCYCNTFAAFKEEVRKRFNVNVYQVLN